ncbi:hypothetical protein F4778DRAFT_319648 [Xylariomycetidae sp. FL2044]|nr:hypothetical protein F4778DRAFT_319648 [Xylariomycetidae sp. FL2044]
MAGKPRCTFKECKSAAQRIVGDCGFCDGHFCAKHRLLEDHKCTGLEDVSRTPSSPSSLPSLSAPSPDVLALALAATTASPSSSCFSSSTHTTTPLTTMSPADVTTGVSKTPWWLVGLGEVLSDLDVFETASNSSSSS